MATLTKRGKRWRAQVRRKGIQLSESFATKELARRWAITKEAEIEERSFTNVVVSGKTLDDALMEYGRRVSINKKGNLWEQRRLQWFSELPMAELQLTSITQAQIAEFRDSRLRQVTGSTVNRDLNLLSHVFTKCVQEWKWMAENPCSQVERPPENPARERRISEAEIEMMRYVLKYEEDTIPSDETQLTALLWLISIETAMRLSEANGVSDDSYFSGRRCVVLETTKNGDKREVALSKRAMSLIELKLDAKITYSDHNVSKCFSDAVKRAGIQDLHYHDSRHEAITRLAQKVGVLDLARIVGTRDLKQLMTYYDATSTEIANRLD